MLNPVIGTDKARKNYLFTKPFNTYLTHTVVYQVWQNKNKKRNRTKSYGQKYSTLQTGKKTSFLYNWWYFFAFRGSLPLIAEQNQKSAFILGPLGTLEKMRNTFQISANWNFSKVKNSRNWKNWHPPKCKKTVISPENVSSAICFHFWTFENFQNLKGPGWARTSDCNRLLMQEGLQSSWLVIQLVWFI